MFLSSRHYLAMFAMCPDKESFGAYLRQRKKSAALGLVAASWAWLENAVGAQRFKCYYVASTARHGGQLFVGVLGKAEVQVEHIKVEPAC